MDTTRSRSFRQTSSARSKGGDDYNYKVAAYLKYKGLSLLGLDYDLRKAEMNVSPEPIIAKATLFQADVSFDIIATTAYWEFFMECKHMKIPKPLTKNTPDFLHALAEFISIEPYREIHNRPILFLLITNAPTEHVQNVIDNILRGDEQEAQSLLAAIVRIAKKKWIGAETSNLSIKHLLKCLLDVRIITIEDGSLRSLKGDEGFEKILQEINDAINKKLPALPPNLPKNARLAIEIGGEDYFSTYWRRNAVFISQAFLEKLGAYGEKLASVKAVTEVDISTISDGVIIRQENEFSLEDAVSAFSSCSNKYLEDTRASFAVIISPSDKKIFLFRPEKILKLVRSLRANNNTFDLQKISEATELGLGPIPLKIAIQESFWRVNGLRLSSDLFK